MPGVEIETVTLDEDIDHPLDAVLERVDRSKTGPLMIVGLERSNPSSAKERPILYALNMSRPDWPKQLPRPIIFWVPEYLLGLMGREAPDFLDWRSDTLFFSGFADESFWSLRSDVWLGGANDSMPERQQRGRIEELKSRLEIHPDTDDPVVLAARSGWLKELGILSHRLGEWNSARENFLAALEIERRLGREREIADILGNLGLIDHFFERFDEAEDALREALDMHVKMGNRRGEAIALGNLASLHLQSGRPESAEEIGRKALRLAEEIDDHGIADFVRSILLGIMLRGDDLRGVKRLGKKALSEAKDKGSLFRRAQILQILGGAFSQEGDLDRAEKHFREALEIERTLGDQVNAARALLALGLLYLRRGRSLAAREVLSEAAQISKDVGDLVNANKANAILRDLDAPSSVPQ